MPRAKKGFKRRQRVKKVFARTEGFYGARNNTFRRATEAADRAGRYAYRDRRRKKREYRSLWIVRVSAGARMHGLSYSQLISTLEKTNVQINRKMLADLAAKKPESFKLLVEKVKSLAA